MAGFGNTLARAVIGGLGGYGDYLTTRGKIEEETKQQEAQSQRAMALEQFRAEIQAGRDATQNEYRRGEIVLSGAVNRSNAVAEVGARATADAANDSRDFKIWQQKNKIEFDTWKQKGGIELSRAKQLELYKTEQSIRADAQKAGGKVIGDVIDESTGSRVYQVQQADGSIRNYDTGIVVQQKSETNPLTGDVSRTTNKPTQKATTGFRDAPATGTGAGGGQRTDLQIALDQLATDYSSGRPIVDPRTGQKLTIQQAQALARKRYGG